jgi:hypothetical protein
VQADRDVVGDSPDPAILIPPRRDTIVAMRECSLLSFNGGVTVGTNGGFRTEQEQYADEAVEFILERDPFPCPPGMFEREKFKQTLAANSPGLLRAYVVAEKEVRRLRQRLGVVRG